MKYSMGFVNFTIYCDIEEEYMSIVQNKTVVGIFAEQNRAEEAIQELGQAGFSRDQLDIMYRTGVPVVDRVDHAGDVNSGDLVRSVLATAQTLLTPILGHITSTAEPASPTGQTAVDPSQAMGKNNASRLEQQPPDVKAEPLKPAAGTQGATAAPVNSGAEKDLSISSLLLRLVQRRDVLRACAGSIAGGVLGTLIALLVHKIHPAFVSSALVVVYYVLLGALAGGACATFVRLRSAAQQPHYYEQKEMGKRTIVKIKTEEHQNEALDILYRHGVNYASIHD
jgi:hypothetical protein